MPGNSNTKDGRPLDSRPAPRSFDPSEAGGETPTPSKKKKNVAAIVKSASARVSPDKVSKAAPASMTTPFRHRWMKKVNSKGVPFAEVGMEDGSPANSSEDVNAAPKSAKRKAKTAGFSPDGSNDGSPGPSTFGSMGPPATPVKEEEVEYDFEADDVNSDGEQEIAFMDKNGKIGEYTKVPSALNTIDKARRKAKSEEGVIDPNGRQIGRKLILWHRPRMFEKLLLHVQYESHKAGVQIPWDLAVHRLQPGSSGPSALQMLNKLRDVLITEGHMIPPVLGKRTAPVDPTLRGYDRDMESNIPTTTKAIRWTDDCPDRKENRVVPGLIRGSGRYRKVAKDDRMHVNKDQDTMSAGQRRNRKPAEVNKWAAEQRALKGRGRKIKTEGDTGSGSARKRRHDEVDEDSVSDIDPADLDSDADFNPDIKKSSSRRKKNNKWSSPADIASPTPKSRERSSKRVPKSESEDDEDDHEDSLVVQLEVSSGGLENFDPGQSGKKPKHLKYFTTPKRLFRKELMGNNQSKSMNDDDESINMSYLGPQLHGSLKQYMKAMEDETDPNLNRLGFQSPEEIYEKVKDDKLARSQLLPAELEELLYYETSLKAREADADAERTRVDDHDIFAKTDRQITNEDDDAEFEIDDQSYHLDNNNSSASQVSRSQGFHSQGSFSRGSLPPGTHITGPRTQVSYASGGSQYHSQPHSFDHSSLQPQSFDAQARIFESQTGFNGNASGQNISYFNNSYAVQEDGDNSQTDGFNFPYPMNTAEGRFPASFDEFLDDRSPVHSPRHEPIFEDPSEPVRRRQRERPLRRQQPQERDDSPPPLWRATITQEEWDEDTEIDLPGVAEAFYLANPDFDRGELARPNDDDDEADGFANY